MPYAKVIVNPVAGAGKTAEKWPEICHTLQTSGFKFDYDLTEARGHAIELAGRAAQKGYEIVVAVGGDGTINEVVNGLHNAGGIIDVMLGIIDTGTCGDYRRTIGLPRDHTEACRCLMNSRRVKADLGVVEYLHHGQMMKRLFVNFAGLGMAAEVVGTIARLYKILGVFPSYILGLLVTLLVYKSRHVSLEFDGQKVDSMACNILVYNGKYLPAGMLSAPHASLSDGFLDAMIFGDIGLADRFRLMSRIFMGDRLAHLAHPKVMVRRAGEIEVCSTQPLLIQADGELLGEVPARFYVLPAALNVII